MSLFTSGYGIAVAANLNVPCSFISRAALMNPVSAARLSDDPTLILRTPIDASSATEKLPLFSPIRTLTGFVTDEHTVRMSSALVSPGA